MVNIVGIDEAGRGPLAGPIAFGACTFRKRPGKAFFAHFSSFPLGKDSKKMSKAAREYWFAKIKEAKQKGLLDFSIVFKSPHYIDKRGLTDAGRTAISKLLAKLKADPKNTAIFLDGGLRAPEEYKKQETIIKGDEKIFVISLSSIVAKVARDRVMVKIGRLYGNYRFEEHKGYATKAHFEALNRYGISPVHRKRFLQKWQSLRVK